LAISALRQAASGSIGRSLILIQHLLPGPEESQTDERAQRALAQAELAGLAEVLGGRLEPARLEVAQSSQVDRLPQCLVELPLRRVEPLPVDGGGVVLPAQEVEPAEQQPGVSGRGPAARRHL